MFVSRIQLLAYISKKSKDSEKTQKPDKAICKQSG